MTDPSDKVRALLRTRQTREFTDEPVGEGDLTALADVARWSGLGAGIAWILAPARETVNELLHVPGEWRVRTIVALGHPSEGGRKPKSAPGKARLPRDEIVFPEHWPDG